ncbi:MAG: hypothetical protein QOG87_4156 [Actinomycetota bacterium]|jgi:hypothetical protein
MRTIRRQGLRVLAAVAVVAAVCGLGAAPASAGPCYIVTVEGGPTATVCPLD